MTQTPLQVAMTYIRAFGGGDTTAVVVYDMATIPFGVVRVADCLTIVDDRIVDEKLIFDARPMSGPAAR